MFLVDIHQDIHTNITTPHKMQQQKHKNTIVVVTHKNTQCTLLAYKQSLWKIVTTSNNLLTFHHQLPRIFIFYFQQLIALFHPL
jgi:hypothetical protein